MLPRQSQRLVWRNNRSRLYESNLLTFKIANHGPWEGWVKISLSFRRERCLSVKKSLGLSWEQNVEGKKCSHDSPSDFFRENRALSYTRAKLLPRKSLKMVPGSFGVVWGSLGRPWEGFGETLGRLWEHLERLWEAFGGLWEAWGGFGKTLGGFENALGRLFDRPSDRPTDYIFKLPINRTCGPI